MKKNLKISSNLKLNIGVTKSWGYQNIEYFKQQNNFKGLIFFQNVQRLFMFSGRSLNFFFRYYYFSFFFRRGSRRARVRFYANRVKYCCFYKAILFRKSRNWRGLFFEVAAFPLAKRKKFFLSTLLNFFSSVNCVSFCSTYFKNFFYIDLVINLCFFSKQVIIKKSLTKENLKDLYIQKLLSLREELPLDMIGRPVNIGDVADCVLPVSFRSKVLKKKIIQKFLLSRFKFFMEKKYFNYFFIPVVFNLRVMPFFFFTKLFNRLQVSGYKKKKLKKFSNHYAIKTLHKIQADLISSVMSAFFSNNAQLVAEQFAIGINRTRKQKQFVFWFVAVLKHYQFFGANMQAVKLIFFGKLGGKMRTQYAKYYFGVPTIRNNTYALKVSYGYSSAETYSGTFGVHVWIQQSDSFVLLHFFAKYNKRFFYRNKNRI